MSTELNIEDYLFEFNDDETAVLSSKIPAEFKKTYVNDFNKDGCPFQWECVDGEDYAFTWAYEIVADLWDEAFHHLVYLDKSKHIEFEFTDEQLNKWWKMHKKYSSDKFVTENDCGDWHLTTEFEGTKKELKQFLYNTAVENYWWIFLFENLPTETGMQPIWDLYIKYRKEAHKISELINGETYEQWYERKMVPWMKTCEEPVKVKKYRNIDGDLPRGWEAIDGFAMPEEVAGFYPGKENMFGNTVFYITDGMWWDLMENAYTEN